MACAVAVARQGQQRNLLKDFPGLRAALARSPMVRIRAWARLTFFCQRDSLAGSGGARTASGCRSGRLGRPVGECHHVVPAQRLDNAVYAGRGQVMGAAGHSCRRPDQPACRVRDDLHVHTVTAVLARVMVGVRG